MARWISGFLRGDDGSLVVESSDPQIETPRTFDAAGNILTEAETLSNGTIRTWTYTYAAGNPIPRTETYVDA